MSVRKDARFPRRRQNGSSDVLGLSETKIRLANASTVTCAITPNALYWAGALRRIAPTVFRALQKCGLLGLMLAYLKHLLL
jgi:hypothetical protein